MQMQGQRLNTRFRHGHENRTKQTQTNALKQIHHNNPTLTCQEFDGALHITARSFKCLRACECTCAREGAKVKPSYCYRSIASGSAAGSVAGDTAEVLLEVLLATLLEVA